MPLHQAGEGFPPFRGRGGPGKMVAHHYYTVTADGVDRRQAGHPQRAGLLPQRVGPFPLRGAPAVALGGLADAGAGHGGRWVAPPPQR